MTQFVQNIYMKCVRVKRVVLLFCLTVHNITKMWRRTQMRLNCKLKQMDVVSWPLCIFGSNSFVLLNCILAALFCLLVLSSLLYFWPKSLIFSSFPTLRLSVDGVQEELSQLKSRVAALRSRTETEHDLLLQTKPFFQVKASRMDDIPKRGSHVFRSYRLTVAFLGRPMDVWLLFCYATDLADSEASGVKMLSCILRGRVGGWRRPKWRPRPYWRPSNPLLTSSARTTSHLSSRRPVTSSIPSMFAFRKLSRFV